ncbi:MAG TPA: hypothetical protein ENK01_01240 [Hellea balneolensis]|uniref:LPS-assembly lipoprotein LptE n=1 Tax=Hellea balneolensis TaxID=287478 RepID=A0A7V5NWY4_9PROT|nr:hypothetical protein [Hellea balneolensis]
MFALIVFTALFAACGFRPMHAPTAFGGDGVSMRNIRVQMGANDKINFLLAQALRDRMGDNRNATYILKIHPETKRRRLGIGADDVASRYDMELSGQYELIRAKDAVVLTTGQIKAVSTYGAPRDPYGTAAAQSNAEDQVAHEAADRIIVQLASWQARQQKDSPGE